MDKMLHVSSSPHVRAKDSTNRIMLYVILALLPTTLFGISKDSFIYLINYHYCGNILNRKRKLNEKMGM